MSLKSRNELFSLVKASVTGKRFPPLSPSWFNLVLLPLGRDLRLSPSNEELGLSRNSCCSRNSIPYVSSKIQAQVLAYVWTHVSRYSQWQIRFLLIIHRSIFRIIDRYYSWTYEQDQYAGLPAHGCFLGTSQQGSGQQAVEKLTFSINKSARFQNRSVESVYWIQNLLDLGILYSLETHVKSSCAYFSNIWSTTAKILPHEPLS